MSKLNRLTCADKESKKPPRIQSQRVKSKWPIFTSKTRNKPHVAVISVIFFKKKKTDRNVQIEREIQTGQNKNKTSSCFFILKVFDYKYNSARCFQTLTILKYRKRRQERVYSSRPKAKSWLCWWQTRARKHCPLKKRLEKDYLKDLKETTFFFFLVYQILLK